MSDEPPDHSTRWSKRQAVLLAGAAIVASPLFVKKSAKTKEQETKESIEPSESKEDDSDSINKE